MRFFSTLVNTQNCSEAPSVGKWVRRSRRRSDAFTVTCGRLQAQVAIPPTPRTKEDLNVCAPSGWYIFLFHYPDARMAKQEELTANQLRIRDVLAANLKHYRKAHGWTVVRLAEETGYSDSWISGIECSRMNSSTDRLAHIAEVLGIDVYLLFIDRR